MDVRSWRGVGRGGALEMKAEVVMVDRMGGCDC